MSRRQLGVLCVMAAAVLILSGCAGRRGPNDPSDLDPGVVALDGALSNRFVAAERPSPLKARLVVNSRNLSRERRPPINLSLVVDTSGSMEGRAIEDARAASLALLDMLSPGDRLSVVAFNSRTEVLIPSAEIDDDDLDELREQLGAMRAEGTTDLTGGLQAGLEQVMANIDPNGINRVVLLSDGVPNDPAPIEGLASAAGQRGVAIIALGLGIEYDELLLGRVAQLSGGRFHDVEDSSQVAGVFRDEVLRLERVVARNASISLMPGPGVAIEAVVGQQLHRSGRGVRIPLGELTEAEAREVVVQLVVPGRRSGANVELFDAVLTFDDALDGAGQLERRMFMGARATDDDELRASGRDDEVERAAARLQAAVETVEAIRLARSGAAEEALDRLDAGVAQLRASAASAEEADRAAEEMERLRDAIPQIADAAASPDDEALAPERVAADSAPAPAPVAAERTVRAAHGRAMDALLH